MSSKPERLAAQRDITVNRRARHDYFIEESLEAGLVLTGSEVKSLRAGKAQLKDSYAQLKQGSSGWSMRTSASTRRRHNSATSRCAPASCCCTGGSSTGWPAKSRSRV